MNRARISLMSNPTGKMFRCLSCLIIESWLLLEGIGITGSKASVREIANLLRFTVIPEAIGSWDWLKQSQKGSFVDKSDDLSTIRPSSLWSCPFVFR